MAVALRASFHGSDVLGRFGGDEFVVLAVDAAVESRELLLHRIARNLERRNDSTREAFAVTPTVGCARFEPASSADLPELLGPAGKALFERGASGNGTTAERTVLRMRPARQAIRQSGAVPS